MKNYEQTLRLLIRFLKGERKTINAKEIKRKTIKEYITNIKKRGKYTVVVDKIIKLIEEYENDNTNMRSLIEKANV